MLVLAGREGYAVLTEEMLWLDYSDILVQKVPRDIHNSYIHLLLQTYICTMDEYSFSGSKEKTKMHSLEKTDKKGDSHPSEMKLSHNKSFSEYSPLRRALEQPPLKKFKVERIF